MRKIYLSTLVIAVIGVTMSGCNEEKATNATDTAKEVTLSTPQEKLGYSIGLQIGAQLAANKEAMNVDALTLGIKDAVENRTPRLSKEEMQATKTAFQQKMQAKAQKEMIEIAEKNLAEGEKFLAENKAKEGVVTLPSGLQYKVIKKGTGTIPTAENTVVTHYTGKLINGQIFDSSVQRGQPATFPVQGVIAGWTEALQLMPVGSKWELYIPAKLAYGERGAGQMIAPNSTLTFEIELLEIKSK